MERKKIENGCFITFEGLSGAGKGTQIELLANKLAGNGWDVVSTRLPGGTEFGEEVRKIFKNPKFKIGSRAELLLGQASFAQLVDEVICPALAADKIVICDRYLDSAIAYQGYGRDADLAVNFKIIEYAIRGVRPSITFLLDLTVGQSAARIKKRSETVIEDDKFENEQSFFQQRVRNGYLLNADITRYRTVVIKANQPIGKVAADIDDAFFAKFPVFL